jgi:hypothetical protein
MDHEPPREPYVRLFCFPPLALKGMNDEKTLRDLIGNVRFVGHHVAAHLGSGKEDPTLGIKLTDMALAVAYELGVF